MVGAMALNRAHEKSWVTKWSALVSREDIGSSIVKWSSSQSSQIISTRPPKVSYCARLARPQNYGLFVWSHLLLMEISCGTSYISPRLMQTRRCDTIQFSLKINLSRNNLESPHRQAVSSLWAINLLQLKTWLILSSEW